MKDESGVFKRPASIAPLAIPEPIDDRCACCGKRMISFTIASCLKCTANEKALTKRKAA